MNKTAIFNISVPAIPARERRHLDQHDRPDMTLVITGGLRKLAKFNHDDLTTLTREMADISGVTFGGMQ